MYDQLDDPTLLSAINKLSSQAKQEKCDLTLSGNILVDSGTWGDSTRFSQKLSLLERAIEGHIAVEIDYVSREGNHTQRKIFPPLARSQTKSLVRLCLLHDERRIPTV